MYMKKNISKLTMLIITLALLFTNFSYSVLKNIGVSSNVAKSSNNLYKRVADPNTMDSYQDFLLNSSNGSRYAGRIWADKSVLTKDGDNGILMVLIKKYLTILIFFMYIVLWEVL